MSADDHRQDRPEAEAMPLCGARLPGGGSCRNLRVLDRKRCGAHGGLSTGPTSKLGKARVAAAMLRGRGLEVPERLTQEIKMAEVNVRGIGNPWESEDQKPKEPTLDELIEQALEANPDFKIDDVLDPRTVRAIKEREAQAAKEPGTEIDPKTRKLIGEMKAMRSSFSPSDTPDPATNRTIDALLKAEMKARNGDPDEDVELPSDEEFAANPNLAKKLSPEQRDALARRAGWSISGRRVW